MRQALITLLLAASALPAAGQDGGGSKRQTTDDLLEAMDSPTFVPTVRVGKVMEGGDSILYMEMNNVYVYPKLTFSNSRQAAAYMRLVRNVKKVYPYALEARQYMQQLDTQLDSIKSPLKRERFVASMEREIVRKYTPILEHMTFSQGKILIKLIDRETARTPYQILRQFRGRLTAL